VHHRVKNNLQVITSMLRLEAGRSDHPATKSVLKDMQDRIRSLALLHESIYRSGTFAAIDLSHYLKQIATQSFRSLQASSSTLELRLDLDTVQVGLDQATPCGLLVSELLSNCFKHAFPDGRTGEVCLLLKPTDTPGQWRLQVSDTGVGLAEDFETRREKSLGLQLVDSLARQLGGSLQTGPGSVFAVTFTANAPAPLKIVV
jgi:two-component sensor histidine kinase